jgi:hypothetical protein
MGHGGVAVAAAWAGRGGVARGGGLQREGKSDEEARARRVEGSRQEVALGRRPRAVSGAALPAVRESREAGRQGKGKRDPNAISKNSRDQSVN